MSDETALAKTITEADVKASLAALENVKDDDAQWAEIAPDFGTTVTFENPGDMFVGILAGSKTVEQPDLNNPGQMRDANVYEFLGTDGERYSIWGSYSIDLKLGDLGPMTPVRIEYKGEREFKDENGAPRRVKSFKVAIPVSGKSYGQTKEVVR